MNARVLEVVEPIWGPMHPNTLSTAFQLAVIRTEQGRLAEAAEQFEAVIAKGKDARGFGAMVKIMCFSGLGRVRARQHEWPEAERLFREAWQLRQRQDGPDHYKTWKQVPYLATAVGAQGRQVGVDAGDQLRPL